MSSTKSSWRLDSSGVHLESILELVLFDIFINDLITGLEYTYSKFTEDIRLGGRSDIPYDCAVFRWTGFDRLKNCTEGNFMKFNKGSRDNNSRHQYNMIADQLERNFAKMNLRVLIDNKMSLTAKKTNSILESIM